MRVLRVIATLNPEHGGPGQGILNITPELRLHGAETDVVCFDDPGSSFLENFVCRVVPLGKAAGAWQSNPRYKTWLKQHLLEYDVVIVHGLWLFHGFATYQVFSGFKRKGLARFPKLYVMPHGMLDPYFQKAAGRRLKAIRNYIYWLAIERRVINYADGVLFTTPEELALAQTTFPFYKPKHAIDIGYGLPEPPAAAVSGQPEIAGTDFQLPDNYFLFLARIHPKKGVDLLIEAYLNLKKTLPDLPPLVIAGPGLDTEFGQEMKRHAGSSESIVFTGMLVSHAKWRAVRNCEAFILPSHQENFGISIVEAMSCGKPVLITQEVNIARTVHECGAGIVERDDLAGTTSLLMKWQSMSNASKWAMGTAARKCFEDNYSIATIAERFLREVNSH